jgi:hypothetical protein
LPILVLNDSLSTCRVEGRRFAGAVGAFDKEKFAILLTKLRYFAQGKTGVSAWPADAICPGGAP